MTSTTKPSAAAPRAGVTFGEALRVWLRIAIHSFGGPAGQIAVMHRVLVEEKRWISEERFLHALNYCMLLPGPEAQQLVTYIGWLLHGYLGGLVAGTLFIVPGFVAILALSFLYVAFQGVGVVVALFFGIKAAVLAVVVEAVLRIGRRVLGGAALVAIAVLSFAAIFFFGVPFPLLVLAAGICGLTGGYFWPRAFAQRTGHASSGSRPASAAVAPLLELPDAPASTRTPARALRVAATCLFLWIAPIALLAWGFGVDSVYTRLGLFFSKAAVVTFGGAYSVLAYIAQQAVETYGWLRPGEMLDGLGLAETTPGPLIQVVQFVAFLGAYRDPGPLSPLLGGVLGSLVTTWVTYVPCFLWIFLGAPWMETLRRNRWLTSALSAITAAVVGVILNLAVWFALHTLFGEVRTIAWHGVRLLIPEPSSVDVAGVVLAAGALVAMLRVKVGMMRTLATCAGLGLVYRLLASLI